MSDAPRNTWTFLALSADRYLAELGSSLTALKGRGVLCSVSLLHSALSLSQPAGLGHRQGHRRPEPIPGWHGKHRGCIQVYVCSAVPTRQCWCGWGVKGPYSVSSCWLPSAGLRFHERDWPTHRECEALFHNGTVWTRQPEASVWYGCGLDCGLLYPLLPLVKDKDVRQWCQRAARRFYTGYPGFPEALT